MDIHFLDQPSTDLSDRQLCCLIAAIGTPAFEQSMLAFARTTIRCTHLTAFSVSKYHSPRTMIAVNGGRSPIARQIASKYIQHYWRLDPANRIIESESRMAQGATIRLSSDEIENASYQHDCYRSVSLIDRISIVKAQAGETVRLNFYRNRLEGRFMDGDLRALSQFANLLIHTLMKHDHIRPALTPNDRFEQYRNRLFSIAPQLSNREIQVCAEIVRGLTSQAIASSLGVSINTVLTHRRRAYAKLNISSQNELSHILLH
jgi:LuxR family transcriptional regulator, activator of tox operons